MRSVIESQTPRIQRFDRDLSLRAAAAAATGDLFGGKPAAAPSTRRLPATAHPASSISLSSNTVCTCQCTFLKSVAIIYPKMSVAGRISHTPKLNSFILLCRHTHMSVVNKIEIFSCSPVKVLDNRDKIATEMISLVMCPDGSQVFQKKSILKYNWWKEV